MLRNDDKLQPSSNGCKEGRNNPDNDEGKDNPDKDENANQGQYWTTVTRKRHSHEEDEKDPKQGRKDPSNLVMVT